MAQRILHSFGGLLTAQIFNDKMKQAVPPGIYAGFKPKINSGSLGGIDLVKGDDNESVLVTCEGVVIQETDDKNNVASVSFLGTSLWRWDMLVCEYQYTSNTAVAAQYKIIRGQLAVEADIVKPSTENRYQVPICYIKVPGNVSALSQDYIVPVPYQQWALTENITALKPVIDVNNNKRIFCYPGVFSNSDQTAIIDFKGAYSDNVTFADISDGASKYVLFGVSDDAEVKLLTTSYTDPYVMTAAGLDAIPVCIAKVKRVSATTGYIESILDVRFPFYRQFGENSEKEPYLVQLATSTFLYGWIDTIGSSTRINDEPISTVTEYSVVFNRGLTQLEITPLVAVPTQDFEIETTNILSGVTEVSQVTHFMVQADCTADVTVDYSASAGGAYSGSYSDLNKTVYGNNISTLYLKFKIDKSEFSGITDTKYFRSYAVYINLNSDALSSAQLDNLHLTDTVENRVNLVDNPFTQWSNTTYILSKDSSEIASDTGISGPDGWQVVYSDLNRLTCEKFIVSQATKAKFIYTGGVPTGKYLDLEYRIPVDGLIAGRRLSFGFKAYSNITAGPGGTYATTVYTKQGGLAAGIRTYKYSSGSYIVESSVFNGAVMPNGEIIVRSSPISSSTAFIGVVLRVTDECGGSFWVENPILLTGEYYTLLAMPSRNYSNIRGLYETGRIGFSAFGYTNNIIQASTQIAPKYSLLGVVKARSITNYSSNVVSLAYTPYDNSLIVQGVVKSDGVVTLSAAWECYIKYSSI